MSETNKWISYDLGSWACEGDGLIHPSSASSQILVLAQEM